MESFMKFMQDDSFGLKRGNALSGDHQPQTRMLGDLEVHDTTFEPPPPPSRISGLNKCLLARGTGCQGTDTSSNCKSPSIDDLVDKNTPSAQPLLAAAPERISPGVPSCLKVEFQARDQIKTDHPDSESRILRRTS
jgi:hypothetical protein